MDKDLNEIMIKGTILKAFEKDGIKSINSVLRKKEDAKIVAKAYKGESFKEVDFEISYLSTKIDVINNYLNLKIVANNSKYRNEIANLLVETANELRTIKGDSNEK